MMMTTEKQKSGRWHELECTIKVVNFLFDPVSVSLQAKAFQPFGIPVFHCEVVFQKIIIIIKLKTTGDSYEKISR